MSKSRKIVPHERIDGGVVLGGVFADGNEDVLLDRESDIFHGFVPFNTVYV